MSSPFFVTTILSVISVTTVLVNSSQLAYNDNEHNAVDVGRNLTLIIYVDENFLEDDYINVMSSVKHYVTRIKTEYLKQSSLKVKYWNRGKSTISGDVNIVLSIAKCSDTWQLYNRLHYNDIFFITITDHLCPRLPSMEAITLPLVRPGEELSQLLLDLRSNNALNWKSASLLYDRSIDDDDVEGIVEALTKEVPLGLNTRSTLVSLHRIINDNQNKWTRDKNLRMILRNLTQFESNQNLLVMVEYDMISLVLDIAKIEQVLNPSIQCLFVVNNLDISVSNISSFLTQLDEGENIAFIYNASKESTTCEGGVLCYVKELLNSLGKALEKSISDEVELSKQVSDEEWDAIKPSKVDRRNTLLNFVMFPPWQILHFNETGHVTQYKGLVFEIIKLLAKNLNFTYDIIVPTNTTLSGFTNSTKYLENSLETLEGEQDESALRGVWNKVIDVVKNKKVFLGACAFTVTDARKTIINFTAPISTEPYVFLLSRPKELSRALLFMSPFTTSTWFCIVAAITLMTPLLCVINRASPFYEANRSKKSRGFNSFMSCFWYIYGALLQQGGGALPAADSSRLVIGTWWLVVLVVVTTYSGNLVAFLTFPKMDKPITNVDELLSKRNVITWGIPANSTLEHLLKATDDPKLHEIYKAAKLHKMLSKELVNSIKDGQHIYIQRKTSLLFLMKHEFLMTNSCYYALGNEEFLSEHLAMAIAQNSPYLRIINKEIGQMHRVGLINKWLQDYLPKKDRCSTSSLLNEVTNHKVNLDDMQGSFFVLLFGFFGSFVLISIEFLIRKYTTSRDKRIVQPFIT